QCPVEDDRPGRARADDRGCGRTSLAAAALAAAGNAPSEPRGPGRDHHRRSRQERPAYAPRPDHPGRNSWRRSVRSARRHEHR
nr:hypothetical protein [Tanacetum cinerariifolium]